MPSSRNCVVATYDAFLLAFAFEANGVASADEGLAFFLERKKQEKQENEAKNRKRKSKTCKIKKKKKNGKNPEKNKNKKKH